MLTNEASHWETSAAELTITIAKVIAPGNWHVVNNPMMLIIKTHSFLEYHQTFCTFRIAADIFASACLRKSMGEIPNQLQVIIKHGQLFYTDLFTLRILHEFNLIWSWPYSLTEHHLTQILHRRIWLIDRTEIEMMILIWDHRFFSIQTIHVQNDVRLLEENKN